MNKHDKKTNELLNLSIINQIQLATLMEEFAKFNNRILSADITHLILETFFIRYDDFIDTINWAKTIECIDNYKIYVNDIILLCLRDGLSDKNLITFERLSMYSTEYQLTLEELNKLNNILLSENISIIYNQSIHYSKMEHQVFKNIAPNKIIYIDPNYDINMQREFDKPSPRKRIFYEIFPDKSEIYYYVKGDPIYHEDGLEIIFEGMNWERSTNKLNLNFFIKNNSYNSDQIIVYLTDISIGSLKFENILLGSIYDGDRISTYAKLNVNSYNQIEKCRSMKFYISLANNKFQILKTSNYPINISISHYKPIIKQTLTQ